MCFWVRRRPTARSLLTEGAEELETSFRGGLPGGSLPPEVARVVMPKHRHPRRPLSTQTVEKAGNQKKRKRKTEVLQKTRNKRKQQQNKG